MCAPNYSAEQTIWILFYCFSIVGTGKWLNWSAAGFVLFAVTIPGSADFSEKYRQPNIRTIKIIKKHGQVSSQIQVNINPAAV